MNTSIFYSEFFQNSTLTNFLPPALLRSNDQSYARAYYIFGSKTRARVKFEQQQKTREEAITLGRGMNHRRRPAEEAREGIHTRAQVGERGLSSIGLPRERDGEAIAKSAVADKSRRG